MSKKTLNFDTKFMVFNQFLTQKNNKNFAKKVVVFPYFCLCF